MTDYVLVRNFLLTQIIFVNACRSGVLANMTAEEFYQARDIDGQKVVSVKDHKTTCLYGPAKVVLNPTLFSWLHIFVMNIRSQISSNANYVFLSWTGEKMSSGDISKSVQTAWTKAGLAGELNCTLMRKSAVSDFFCKFAFVFLAVVGYPQFSVPFFPPGSHV